MGEAKPAGARRQAKRRADPKWVPATEFFWEDWDMSLGFRVETRNGARIKVRDDGRFGPCVADEALLWDALQEALGIIEAQRQQLDAQGLADQAEEVRGQKGRKK